MKRMMGWLLALTLFALSLTPTLAQDGAATAAASWIEGQINADGGFGDGFSDGSSAAATADAVLAGVAAGVDVSTWGEGASPLDYLASQTGNLSTTGLAAKTALVALATGQEPHDFGGTDLVEQVMAAYDTDSGAFSGTVTDHAFAMLALNAAGEEVPADSVMALVGLQAEDGGWSFDGTSQPDTNTTGLALQALAAAGEPNDSEAVTQALEYLRGQQGEDGGFPYQNPSDFGTESDANSTAWAIQGLLASGESLADWNNPQEFLASLQGEDGSLQWKREVPGANFLATVQAVPALASMTFVDMAVAEASPPAQATDEESSDETSEEAASEDSTEEDAAGESESEAAAGGDKAPETVPDAGGRPLWPVVATVAGGLLLLEGYRRRRAA